VSPEGSLAGLRVVVTRPRGQAAAFTRLLEGSGAEVIELPTIEIVEPEDWGPADRAMDRLGSYGMGVFTSANGVVRFLDRLESQGHSLEEFRSLRLVAIGPVTARALEARGLAVEIVPAEYRAEGVVDAVAGLGAGSLEGMSVLLPRALEAREVLPESLRALGARVDVVPVYRTVLPERGRERAAEILQAGVDVITFTSSSTVRNFVRLVGAEHVPEALGGAAVGCIGPITAVTARAAGLAVDIQPREYTVEGFHAALVDHFRG
jgi:uroporphyrinogen III methyltransferase/synthase